MNDVQRGTGGASHSRSRVRSRDDDGEQRLSSPVAIYVHIPFCPSKCGYCDFNSHVMEGEILARTVDAIEREIEASPHAGRPAKTIFFGGGTPTFLEAKDLARLLKTVLDVHPPADPGTIEITSEANPGTVDAEKFSAMREAGFNRLSMGVQSFNSEDLLQLGRIHRGTEVVRAVFAARSAGFANLNLDLMYGLPGQSLPAWKSNMAQAMELAPDHLSMYCLTIEPNTRFDKYFRRGTLSLPSDDMQVAMNDLAHEFVRDYGFSGYEISNFCKPGYESQHNLCYWRGEEYLGYGPGAVGCYAAGPTRQRYTNWKHPLGYCERMESAQPLWGDQELLSPDDQKLEKIMLGLRLKEGVSQDLLAKAGVEKVTRLGWARVFDNRLVLTDLGRHFCTEVAVEVS